MVIRAPKFWAMVVASGLGVAAVEVTEGVELPVVEPRGRGGVAMMAKDCRVANHEVDVGG